MNTVLKDKSGAALVLKYIGVVNLSEETGKVLGGKWDAKTTQFGDVGEFSLGLLVEGVGADEYSYANTD